MFLNLFLSYIKQDDNTFKVSPITAPACDTSVRTADDISSKSFLTASKTEADLDLADVIHEPHQLLLDVSSFLYKKKNCLRLEETKKITFLNNHNTIILIHIHKNC